MTDVEQGKSPDNPWPVRAVATRVASNIHPLGTVWIEGQLTELRCASRPLGWCCVTPLRICR